MTVVVTMNVNLMLMMLIMLELLEVESGTEDCNSHCSRHRERQESIIAGNSNNSDNSDSITVQNFTRMT
jgi:hypothetical protein